MRIALHRPSIRSLRILAGVVTFVAASAAFATVQVPCNYDFSTSVFGPWTSLTIVPSNPNSDQTIDIAAGYSGLTPVLAATQVQGSVINVTLTGAPYFNDIAPLPGCMTTTVGPLAPGAYVVNLYLNSPFTPDPQLLKSAPLIVIAATDALSCFAPTQANAVCTSSPGCIFVCPQPPVSSAKLNLRVVLSQLPADACVPKLNTSIAGDSIQITGTYVRCPDIRPAPPPLTYLYLSLEPLPAGHYTVAITIAADPAYPSSGSPPDAMVLTSSLDVAASSSSQPNFQGLWWAAPAGSESGWGINLAHQGNFVFLTWFKFDFYGKAHWWVSTAKQTAYGIAGDFVGDLYDGTGPAFDSVPFPAIGAIGGATGAKVGVAHLIFDDANNGLLIFTVDGYEGSNIITREVFGRVPNCTWGVEKDLSLAPNYTDLWWASPPGSEAGWGINLTHQGDIVFATWFTFDHDRTPMWLVVQANKTGPGTYAGTLIKAISGPPLDAKTFPPLGSPGGPIGVTAGTANFNFSDGNSAQFTYTVNGVTQTKSITREVFVAPGTVCQ